MIKINEPGEESFDFISEWELVFLTFSLPACSLCLYQEVTEEWGFLWVEGGEKAGNPWFWWKIGDQGCPVSCMSKFVWESDPNQNTSFCMADWPPPCGQFVFWICLLAEFYRACSHLAARSLDLPSLPKSIISMFSYFFFLNLPYLLHPE